MSPNWSIFRARCLVDLKRSSMQIALRISFENAKLPKASVHQLTRDRAVREMPTTTLLGVVLAWSNAECESAQS